MNNKLRYLALALLITTGLNANPDGTASDEFVGSTLVNGAYQFGALVSEKAQEAFDAVRSFGGQGVSSEDSTATGNGGVVASVKALPGAIKTVANNGIAGVESFVANNPKSVAGVATVATVVAVYSFVKWRAAAHKAATLKEQLEEVNAITA